MKNIFLLSMVTLKGGIRDRTLFGIWILATALMLSTPLLASFSMRQVAVVACDFTLAISSFVGLLLTIFVGNNLIAKDIDRRSIYTVISLPLKRSHYLLGKFGGLLLLLTISLAILSLFGFIAIQFSLVLSPQKINLSIDWQLYFIAILFVLLKLIIVAASVFLFSSVATSSFLPLALALIFYFVSESVEEVKAFIETSSGDMKPNPVVIQLAKVAFLLFPNFEAFDFTPNALYSIPVASGDLFSLILYALSYTVIIMSIAIFMFNKREFI